MTKTKRVPWLDVVLHKHRLNVGGGGITIGGVRHMLVDGDRSGVHLVYTDMHGTLIASVKDPKIGWSDADGMVDVLDDDDPYDKAAEAVWRLNNYPSTASTASERASDPWPPARGGFDNDQARCLAIVHAVVDAMKDETLDVR